jgi:hypothetical protein
MASNPLLRVDNDVKNSETVRFSVNMQDNYPVYTNDFVVNCACASSGYVNVLAITGQVNSVAWQINGATPSFQHIGWTYQQPLCAAVTYDFWTL